MHVCVYNPITPLLSSLDRFEAEAARLFGVLVAVFVVGEVKVWSVATCHVQIDKSVASLLIPLQSHSYLVVWTGFAEI